MDSFSESFDFSNNRLVLHRCYECDSQVTIVATSLPTCPNCYSEFVEEIEIETSNYIFDDSPPSIRNGGVEFDSESREAEVVDRVQTMLQQLLSSNNSSLVMQEEEAEDPYFDLNEYDNETDNDSDTGTHEDTADREDIFTTILNMDDATYSESRNSSLPQNFSNFIQHLLDGANASMGGANPLWNLLELHGEPGDYVFGEQGLDNVITQLMEQPGYSPFILV
ncbi:hypothetical protein K7432_000813 [Basidiobolus ranarum]|uniref:RING-type E3 ubiquitin transferase n=1 Tax=Basidiobolus ranarum TaxID=34480 RepID=A0ABR2WAM3_9FUNG